MAAGGGGSGCRTIKATTMESDNFWRKITTGNHSPFSYKYDYLKQEDINCVRILLPLLLDKRPSTQTTVIVSIEIDLWKVS